MNLIFDLKQVAAALILGVSTSVLTQVPHPHDTEACGEKYLALFLTLEVNTGNSVDS